MARSLDFYARPAAMTSAGQHASALAELPSEVDQLVRIVQGVLIYDVVAADFYGFRIPDGRAHEIHIRPIERVLDRIFALDSRPLSVPRPVDRHLASRCRQYTGLLVAMLRAQRMPARARCGFAAYFNPDMLEDHWVGEYWHAAEERWVLVDAQLDEVWRARLTIEFDPLDVPRDQFLVAGDAWAKSRAGGADPATFGISFAGLRGYGYIAGDVVRDLAALNKVEMLPWDVWGCMPRPDQSLEDDQLHLFDRVAALTRPPDTAFNARRALYESDERLRVPTTVHNALLNRDEPIGAVP
jgi:hypothetical protein